MTKEKNPLVYFEDLSLDFKNKIVFLDIDGTIVSDNQVGCVPAVIAKLKKLAAENRIFLCTNSSNEKRNREIERQCGFPLLPRSRKKPSPKAVSGLSTEGQALVVIGDKFLTDFLFAKNIGATFIKVKRKEVSGDRWWIKLLYRFDDFLFALYTVVS